MLSFFIARRYLFAKKSHNVINLISAISAAGMAVGTAALIMILSVYNGFDDFVKSTLSDIEPDILISPAKGKVFVCDERMYNILGKEDCINTVCSILEDNVYLSYDGRNSVARCRGVDSLYEVTSMLRNHLEEGKFSFRHGEIEMAQVGSGLAGKMELSPRFLQPLDIFYPVRDRQFSASNPTASLESVRAFPSGVFTITNERYNELVLISIEQMRELMGYSDEVSSLEVRVKEGTSTKEFSRLIKRLSAQLGEDFRVYDRFRQNESLYKMMKYEKASVFLILVFVVIIIAFNIFGSLSMLIIEKKEDIATLVSLGATPKLIRHIFVLEGWMISLLGMFTGVVVGVACSLAQQKFGFVKMPGNFRIDAYPVILEWGDVALAVAAVAIIGYIIAFIPAKSSYQEEI